MAQMSPNRSEFMTSDLGLTNIEYKRKGGCFFSHKKIAAIILMFIIGVIAAGVIGAYFSPWKKNRTFTTLTLAEEDEFDEFGTSSKFSSSPLILPTLYTIKLTPVIEESTVKKFSGHVVVRFNYNSTEPLSHLVLNAKDITVSKAKLFSFDDTMIGNVRSRKIRRDLNEEDLNSGGNSPSEITTTVTTLPDDYLGNSSLSENVLNVTSIENTTNYTPLNSTNEDVSTIGMSTLNTTPVDIVNLKNETHSVTDDSVSTGTSEHPLVVQKISTSRPIPPETSIQSKEIPISKDETDKVDGFYVIYPDTPIRRGEYSVEITYEAKVDRQRTFDNIYEFENESRWLLATKLNPLGPRTLFPSFDDPNSKARFALSVVRPKALIALANMPLQSSDSVSDDWVMDNFEISPPLSSRNLAYTVGDLQPIRETTAAGERKIPLTLWGRNNKIEETHFIAEKMDIVTQTLNQFFSTPYTMPKLDVVALPGLVVDGWGSTGLISIRESLFYMSDKTSVITKEIAVKNLVYLIGKQWLGGLVSAKALTDVWILEGSLIYLKNLLAEKIDSTLDLSDSFGDLQHDVLEADSYETSKTLNSKFSEAVLETTYTQIAYKKGACLIRMLHNVISDSGFRNGYKKFISRWINASASVSDFWKSMSEEAEWLPDGVSLEQVMNSWVGQSGFPVLNIIRNYESGSAVVGQEQFVHDNSTISKLKYWHIPLTYVSDGDDWSSPKKSWFKQGEKINLQEVGKGDEKKWVLFNVNQTGYYRVNYDLDNWKLLSSALNSTFEKFPVTTRTSLVDDALSLAWSGRLEYHTALNLICYLREKETHHSPWTVTLKNMIKLNNLLQNTVAYSSFQEFMIKFISPMLKKVTTDSGDSQLKLMAIKWACLIDNPECQSYVKNLSNVPTYLEETYQCTLAKFGGKSEWDSLISKTLNSKDREMKLKIFAALPCFQIEWILQSLLTDILKGEKFDVVETLVLLQSFSENPTAARTAFKFVQRHWDEIFERFAKSYSISKAFIIASINGITDEEDLKIFQIFKEEYYDKLKFMGHTIAVAEAEARSRSSWLKRNLLPVERWLKDYIKEIS